MTKPNLPRGIRNNNPGNIRRTTVMWMGETESDEDAFEVFAHPAYGLRALMVNLRSYMVARGLVTIRQIIARWAPPTENSTLVYSATVSAHTGFGLDEKLNTLSAHLVPLAKAIVRHENGTDPYPTALYELAFQMMDAQSNAAADRMLLAFGDLAVTTDEVASASEFAEQLDRLNELSALLRSELSEFEAQARAAITNA